MVKRTLAKLKAHPSLGSSRKALMIPKPFIPCKYYGFNDHHYNKCEYYPGCDLYGSIDHETTDCVKRKPKRTSRVAPQQSTKPTANGGFRHMTGMKQYLHRYSKESGPKVVFGDNSLGDTEGYRSINYNGIIFTKVAYVNGLKHNLISISQMCDANFKKKSDAVDCIISFIRKMENLNEVKVKKLRSDNGTEFKNLRLEEFYDEKVAKAFRVFNIRRQEMEETYHVTFSKDNEAISQTSTKGDTINFNEKLSFPDDKFPKPRRKITQGSRNSKHLPYILAYDHLSSNNINIPECPASADSHCIRDSVSPDE
ncbi:hypothetical protein Tco_1438322 [Tanacetum coccineum]